MELLAVEYFKVVDIVSAFDSHLMVIKGWSITVCVTLIGYALKEKHRSVLLAGCLSALCFFVVDLKYKQYQTTYYARMVEIETCWTPTKKECEKQKTLNIHKSWENEIKDNLVWNQLDKSNVYMPHLFLFLISLFLYLNPRLFASKET